MLSFFVSLMPGNNTFSRLLTTTSPILLMEHHLPLFRSSFLQWNACFQTW